LYTDLYLVICGKERNENIIARLRNSLWKDAAVVIYANVAFFNPVKASGKNGDAENYAKED